MVDQTPLTNADFRKLLATPRPNRDGGSKPSETPGGGGGGRGAGDKAKKPYRPKPKPTSKEEEGEDDEPKYRDRAEERRRGVNPDYNAANQLLGVIGSNGDVDPTKLSVEDSKYLGGDLDHTHLVKGLDYALLQKMREAAEKRKEKEAEEKEKEAVEAATPKTAHTVLSTGRPLALPKKEDFPINHPIARGVYNALFNPPRSSVHEAFLPRRMAFVYEFDADEYGVVHDIPTTVRRSKADCPKPVEAVFARMDNLVLERIAKIMSYIKTGAGGKKIKKKDRDEVLGELKGGLAAGMGQQASAAGAGGQQGTGAAVGVATAGAAGGAKAAAAADEEEDIFGDAGTDYKPVVKKKESKAGGAGDDMELEEGEAVPGPAPPPPGMDAAQAAALAYGAYPDAYGQYADAYGGQYGADPYGGQYAAAWQGSDGGVMAPPPPPQPQQAAADEPKWRVRPKKAEERSVEFVDDAYGEYYPMAAGLDLPVLEDDEDETLTGKAARLANTKAEPVSRSEKEVAREGAQKINTQLQKIEHILKEKGHDHSGAFGRTPSRKTSTGEDPNLVRANEGRKRPRI